MEQDINLKKFIESSEGIIIQFCTIHYQAIVLLSKKSQDMIQRKLDSHTMFQSDYDKKCCPPCNKLICIDEPNCVEHVLHELWVHYNIEVSCLKHQADEDVEDLDESDDFYCCTCIDKLILFQKTTKEDCSIESIINCLR